MFELDFKPLVVLAISLIVFLEIRNRYFALMPRFWKSVRWTPWLRGLGAFGLALLLLIPLDQWLAAEARQLTDAFGFIVSFGRTIGKNDYFWAALLSFYAAGILLRNARLKAVAFGTILASSLTAVVVTMLKFFFLRARPSTDSGPLSFFNWQGFATGTKDFQSFPSGDVSLVAGAACYLFFAVKDSAWRWLLLLLPIATSLARVHLNRHWPSDTLTSMALAIIIGKYLASYEQRLETSGLLK